MIKADKIKIQQYRHDNRACVEIVGEVRLVTSSVVSQREIDLSRGMGLERKTREVKTAIMNHVYGDILHQVRKSMYEAKSAVLSLEPYQTSTYMVMEAIDKAFAEVLDLMHEKMKVD